MRNPRRIFGLILAALSVIAYLAAVPPSAAIAAPPAAQPQGFAAPDAAADALDKAMQANDTKALLTIFGSVGEKLVVSGDPVADGAARKRFVDAYAAAHTLTPGSDGQMVLTIGPDAWPLPIPLVQAANAWHFDASAAAQQIIDRRIGRNELMTIRTLLAVVAAQKDYFDRLQRGAGTGAYAERFLSTPGEQNGLYWQVATGEPPSPLGPLVVQAESEGYPDASTASGRRTPYQGYYYHMLTGQGPEAPGGAKSYVKNGHMTEGFAIIAWPATYASSGITTFLVDQDGVVFQKDLGRQTGKIAAGISRFDPDVTWARIDLKD